MPILIGAPTDRTFDDPLGLLTDCHRRIERFLAQLIAVVSRAGDEPIAEPDRTSLEAAIRYFQRAAPWHTQDEEASLFPRLRESGGADALARVERLEADHRRADEAHSKVDALGRRVLDEGNLSKEELSRMAGLLQDLQQLYAPHIALEEAEVFPMAGRLLDRTDLAAIGREMADRRGVKRRT